MKELGGFFGGTTLRCEAISTIDPVFILVHTYLTTIFRTKEVADNYPNLSTINFPEPSTAACISHPVLRAGTRGHIPTAGA